MGFRPWLNCRVSLKSTWATDRDLSQDNKQIHMYGINKYISTDFSVIECLLSMHEAPDLISSFSKTIKKETRKAFLWST